jgi:hypothetical protein
MNEKLKILILIFTTLYVLGCSSKNLNFRASTNLHKSEKTTLSTNVLIDYKFKIKSLSNNKIETSISGTINPEYDHFLNEIKTNTFTGFCIDF